MYIEHAFGKSFRFCPAHCRTQGLNLSVDIGLGHMVQIDQGERRYTAACQSLYGPRAHAAQANNRHSKCPQTRIGRLTVQTAQAAETPLQVGVLRGLERSRPLRIGER